ncbi:MAG: polysaccharide biosynthesis/export family protein [Segetibacter sp.]
MVYFNQQGDTALAKTVQNYEPLIQPGDRLSIIVNALDAVSAAPYNLGSPVSVSTTASSSGSQPSGSANGGYVVEADGFIQFPQLGKIQVAGMQRKTID